MAEQIKNDNSDMIFEQTFNELKKSGGFDIKPCDVVNIDDHPKFKKLELTNGQKMQMSAFASQLPAMAVAFNGASALSKLNTSTLYVMEVPNGLPYTLTQLKDGGFSNTLRGVDGKFVKQLPLTPVDFSSKLAAQSVILSAFSAMSVFTGQYFLSKINSDLKIMKSSIDKILEFLYGDKKAELISEVSFVQYAYQNYNYIMPYDNQRIATISSLQEARKIAIKDCEFYIRDLEDKVTSNPDISATVDKAIQIKESLELAMQLYVTGSLLEVYYSQNYESGYLSYVERDILAYISKCEKNMLSTFSILLTKIRDFKGVLWNQMDKEHKERLEKRVNDVIDMLHNGGESDMRKALSESLHMPMKKREYYISSDGNVYIKSA